MSEQTAPDERTPLLNMLSAEECRDICSLAETDGKGTVSLAEEDLEFVCAQAALVPSLEAANAELRARIEAMEGTLRKRSDNAYCDYIAYGRRTESLGWEAKVKAGQFGKPELDAHCKAAELLGRHRALHEAAELLDAALKDMSNFAHTNHPLHHWDRTCPACLQERPTLDQCDCVQCVRERALRENSATQAGESQLSPQGCAGSDPQAHSDDTSRPASAEPTGAVEEPIPAEPGSWDCTEWINYARNLRSSLSQYQRIANDAEVRLRDAEEHTYYWEDMFQRATKALTAAREQAAQLERLLNGMVGLVQLVSDRVPDIKTNHRYVDALTYLEKK